MRRRLPAVLLLYALLSGHEDGCACAEEEGPADVASGASCPQASTLTYDTFGRDFFATYCLRCHDSALTGPSREGAPTDHNFETRALVEAMRLHIDLMAAAGPAAVNTRMPKGAPLPTEAERRLLGEWLACGAK